MISPISLPYFNSVSPPILPTLDQIRDCSTVLWERNAAKVVAVDEEVVVKYGGGVRTSEGHALIYLERHAPHIPAPRLYAMYEDRGQLFLVMQRAHGSSSDVLWPSLTSDEKNSISAQLKIIFDDMSAIQCPEPGFFGSLDGGSFCHELFYDQNGGGTFLGPYRDEQAFVDGLTQNFRTHSNQNKREEYKVKYYEAHLARVLRDHKSTLTHSDVQRKNIIVRKRGRSAGTEGVSLFDIVLVDWEMSGWYPEYWEYFNASSPWSFRQWDDDWCWHLTQFLKVLPAEVAIMHEFDRAMM